MAGSEHRLQVTLDGRTEVVDGDREVSFGRDPSCDMSLQHDLVSRRHGVLRLDGDSWVVEDAGSTNGTFRNGERVIRVEVRSGVVLRLGHPETGPVLSIEPVTTEVHADAPPAAPSPPPALTPTLAPSPVPAPPTPVSTPAVSDGRTAVPLDPGKRSVIYRPDRAVVRIGRDADNEIVLDDLLVSRHHAELRGNEAGGFEIVDSGSHNGTFVNGHRVERCALGPADVIAIGHRQFHLVGNALQEYVDEGEITFEALGLSVQTPNGRVLLDNVSFSLDRNTFMAVVGPSGAGKSTLLNALTGFRPAGRGTVLYDGRDLYAEYDELQTRIGLVPQDDVLHPQLTVGRALEFAAELRFADDVSAEERSTRVDEVLEELGLTARRDLPIEQLSGGQRKRVSVALELLTKPSLLFLDEPTSGLDPGYERSLMELLRGLADGGRTVVVVTHSVQSLDLCDRVLFLAPGGHTAYFGPADEARRFFRRDDFQEVFRDLSSDEVVDWTARFQLDPAYEQYVSRPAARAAASASRSGAPPPLPMHQQSWWRQFSTLTRRYVAVLARDRKNLGLMLAQAPIFGILMLVALPADGLKPVAPGNVDTVSNAALVLWVVGLAATWLGLSNAAREIVKELPIFRRERAAGLSLSAYIASKAAVLGALTVVQSIVLVAIATARQHGPTDAVVIGWPLGELMVAAALTGIAAMALGLLVSAASNTSDQVMSVLPILLILETILATGGLFPSVVDKPVLKQLSYGASQQWGFSASAVTADLNDLQVITNRLREIGIVNRDNVATKLERAFTSRSGGDARYEHTAKAWWSAVLALVALTIAALIAAGLVLARRDPGPAP